MTYEQTLDYIHSTLKFGSKPGLSRIRALMEALGNPQDTLRYVHITGTNGKGSTTTMVSNILRQAGLRVGTFISPYVDEILCYEYLGVMNKPGTIAYCGHPDSIRFYNEYAALVDEITKK